MRIGRAGTIDELDGEAWARFATDAGITFPFFRRRVSALTERIEAAIAGGEDVADVAELRERTMLRARLVWQTTG
ncbi:HipA-like protein [Sphingomonas sp. MM-1]|uniref:hypothetical protein n=1 Tax=Sphingomonas sp. MM-1 TaxID=745310 RepID=UPI0002C0BE67|nr:hypothetical protein [Sphingomonas sp. MM-1]AGH49288.1 HipA-like protein [Sphingomonas sp. MM-1]